MRIVIIGSNSGLAKYFINYMSSKNIEINGYDIQDKSFNQNINYQKIDFTDKKNIEKINFNCDAVYIFSGLTGPEISMKNYSDFIRVNVILLMDILDTIIKSGFKCKVIYPSSRLVYIDQDEVLTEKTPLSSKSVYGLSKIFAENILEFYNRNFGIQYTIYRIGIPFNDINNTDDSDFGIFAKLIRQAKNNQITLYGNGNSLRTFTHINDICELFFKSLTNDYICNQTFNIGGHIYSLLEVSKAIQRRTECDICFMEWPEESKMVEVKNGSLSSERLNSVIPIEYINIMDVIDNYEK